MEKCKDCDSLEFRGHCDSCISGRQIRLYEGYSTIKKMRESLLFDEDEMDGVDEVLKKIGEEVL